MIAADGKRVIESGGENVRMAREITVPEAMPAFVVSNGRAHRALANETKRVC